LARLTAFCSRASASIAAAVFCFGWIDRSPPKADARVAPPQWALLLHTRRFNTVGERLN
jgi:hypothetical protein